MKVEDFIKITKELEEDIKKIDVRDVTENQFIILSGELLHRLINKCMYILLSNWHDVSGKLTKAKAIGIFCLAMHKTLKSMADGLGADRDAIYREFCDGLLYMLELENKTNKKDEKE